MTKRKAPTKSQLRAYLQNLAIKRNQTSFKPGSIISANELAEMFHIPVPALTGSYEHMHQEKMRMVKLQNQINKLLRPSGLYLKSRQYYKYFTVVDKATTKAQVERMSASVDRLTTKADELEQGMRSATDKGSWGTYTKLKHEQVNEQLEDTTSKRHERVVKRLARIK